MGPLSICERILRGAPLRVGFAAAPLRGGYGQGGFAALPSAPTPLRACAARSRLVAKNPSGLRPVVVICEQCRSIN
jgi:hypothetical protein